MPRLLAQVAALAKTPPFARLRVGLSCAQTPVCSNRSEMTMNDRLPAATDYRADIDGLRAVAVPVGDALSPERALAARWFCRR